MISFDNKLFLGAILEGKELPLEVSAFKSLQLSSSRKFVCPQGQLVIADAFGFFKETPLTDNQSLTLILGANQTSAVEYTFRIFSVKREDVNNIPYYTLTLIYNAPRWIYENKTRALVSKTSSEAISDLAEESFLSHKVTETADRQNWYPVAEKRCMFAERIALHGYSSETSCMMLGLTLAGELRYIDVCNIDYKKAFSFVTGIGNNQDAFSVVSKKHFNKSGQNNAIGGSYKKVTIDQDPFSKKSTGYDQHSRVSITTTNNALLLNQNISQRIEGSVVNFGTINCGNVHKNYTKAVHQNKRLQSFFSSGLYVIIQTPTTIDLFDPVNFTVFNMESNEPVLNDEASGSYFVSSKTIFIGQDGIYNEKLELLRVGTNVEVTNE